MKTLKPLPGISMWAVVQKDIPSVSAITIAYPDFDDAKKEADIEADLLVAGQFIPFQELKDLMKHCCEEGFDAARQNKLEKDINADDHNFLYPSFNDLKIKWERRKQ